MAGQQSGRFYVMLHRPGIHADKIVTKPMGPLKAKAEAGRLNRELNEREGVPVKAPFAFHYVASATGADVPWACGVARMDKEAEAFVPVCMVRTRGGEFQRHRRSSDDVT